jgi:arginyl-tRNA--protein-N-Asp/Glu arginylyltransferase
MQPGLSLLQTFRYYDILLAFKQIDLFKQSISIFYSFFDNWSSGYCVGYFSLVKLAN